MSKFRCGVAPIRIETGRYERLSVDERICPLCRNGIEDEKHVLIHCPAYNCIRTELFEKAALVNNGFQNFTDDNKLNFVLSNSDMVRQTAKSCYPILDARKKFIYNVV